jgi:polysaccharide export outer membrane protein
VLRSAFAAVILAFTMVRLTESRSAEPCGRPLRNRAALTLAAVLLAASIFSCGGRPTSRVNLPPPVESTTVGPGDVFEMTIVGEDKLPKEYRVAPDGTADLPYIHRMPVAGLEPQQLTDSIRQKLIEARIFTDPSVSIEVKEYNSKRVSVFGQVQRPGSFPLAPGITLVQALSQAGGFSAIANHDRINLTRKIGSTTRTVVVSVDAITDGSQPDIPLQAGDTVYVTERIF